MNAGLVEEVALIEVGEQIDRPVRAPGIADRIGVAPRRAVGERQAVQKLRRRNAGCVGDRRRAGGLGVRLGVPDRQPAVKGVIIVGRQPDLLHVIGAGEAHDGDAHALNRRQGEGGEDADDRENDEKLNQGETGSRAGGTHDNSFA